MTELIALVVRILSILSTVAGYSLNILGFVTNAAQEHSPFAVETIAANAANTVNSPTFGNAALLAAIADAKAQGIADTASILVAITDLTDGTTPIYIPAPTPGSLDADTLLLIADYVWNNAQPNLLSTPSDALKQVARSLDVTNTFDLDNTMGIFKVARISWITGGIYLESVLSPVFDPNDIGAGENLLDVLTRQNPDFTVSYPWDPQRYVGLEPPGGYEPVFITVIDEAGFIAYKNALGIGSTSRELSLWPGIANVVLGDPVDLTAALDVDVPMNGAIITLATVPPDKPRYTIGSLVATAHIGQIAFKSDNGDMEYPQNLSFPSEVYIPTSMVVAAGVKVRCVPGVTGTITPYTILTV